MPGKIEVTNTIANSFSYYADRHKCLHEKCEMDIVIIMDYAQVMADIQTDIAVTLFGYFDDYGDPVYIQTIASDLIGCASNEDVIDKIIERVNDAVILYKDYNKNKNLTANHFVGKIKSNSLDNDYCAICIRSNSVTVEPMGGTIQSGTDIPNVIEALDHQQYPCQKMSVLYGDCKNNAKDTSNIYCDDINLYNLDVATFNTPIFFNKCYACNLCIKTCAFSKAICNIFTRTPHTMQEIDSAPLKEKLVDNMKYANQQGGSSFTPILDTETNILAMTPTAGDIAISTDTGKMFACGVAGNWIDVTDVHSGLKTGVHGITTGVNGSKPGSPAIDDKYFATDTKIFWYCFVAGTWTDISKTHADLITAHGWSFGSGAPATVIGTYPVQGQMYLDYTNKRLYGATALATWVELVYPGTANPTTQAFSDTAVVGTSVRFSRQDHKHAMPVNPVTAHNTYLASNIHGCTDGNQSVLPLTCRKGEMYFALDTGRLYRAVSTDTWLLIGSLDFALISHAHAGSDITSGSIDGDRIPAPSTSKKGGVPAIVTTSNGKFLRDDGGWQTPAYPDVNSLIILERLSLTKEFPFGGTPTTMSPATLSEYSMIVMPFMWNKSVKLDSLYILTNLAVTDCLRLAIYDKAGTQVWESGSLTTVADVFLGITSLAITLAGGLYYLGFTNNLSSSSTLAYKLSPALSGGFNLPGWGEVPIINGDGVPPTSFDPASDIGSWSYGFPIYTYLMA